MPLFVQRLKPRPRVGDAQEWPPVVSAHAPPELVQRRVEVDGNGALAQHLSILRPEDAASAGGDDPGAAADQFFQNVGFEIAKRILALALEQGADGPARAPLDGVV